MKKKIEYKNVLKPSGQGLLKQSMRPTRTNAMLAGQKFIFVQVTAGR